MSFEVGKNVQSAAIERNTLRQADGMKKLDEAKFNAIWDKFDTNNDGKLNQDEQVALLAFMDQLSGEDDKVTRKEAKAKKNALGTDFSYKDYKRVSQGLSQVIDNNTEDNVELKKTHIKNQYTVNQTAYRVIDNQVKSKLDDNGHVAYDYHENGRLKSTTNTTANDTTITTYDNTGKNKLKEVKTNKDKTITTTTDYQPGTNTPVKTVEIDTSEENITKRTTTTPQGKTIETVSDENDNKTTVLEEFDTSDNRLKTTKNYSNTIIVTDYRAKTETILGKNTTFVQAYETINYDGIGSNLIRTIYTNNNKKLETTKEGNKTTIRSLESGGKSVVVEGGKAKIAQIELDTSSDGKYVLTNASFNGKNMDTVEETAIKLGFEKDSPEYQEIINANANRKAGEAIKIPIELTTKSTFKADSAKVDPESEKNKYNDYQNNVRKAKAAQEKAKAVAEQKARAVAEQKIATTYRTNTDNALANWDKKNSTRCTYATDNFRVFCDVTKNQKGYQQHYVYSDKEKKMVNIETVIPAETLKGRQVRMILPNGKAFLAGKGKGEWVQLELKKTDLYGKAKASGDKVNGKYVTTAQYDKLRQAGKTLADAVNDSTILPQEEKTVLAGAEEVTKAVKKFNSSTDKKLSLVNENNAYIYYRNSDKAYFYYDPGSKTMKPAKGIANVDEQGTIYLSNGNPVTNQQFISASALDNVNSSLYNSLNSGNGSPEARLASMPSKVKAMYNSDNVINLYRRYDDGENTILSDITSNNLTSSKKDNVYKGREVAYEVATHIISKLIERANRVEDLNKDSKAYMDAAHFIKNDRPALFNRESYLKGEGKDRDLSWVADPIINHLTELIEYCENPPEEVAEIDENDEIEAE